MNNPRRAREFGFISALLPTGPLNSITDVAGVRVGHCTLQTGEGQLRPGCGPVRTGVTVILPHGGNLFLNKVHAAVHTINGFGKACGFEQVRELGVLESPIALTNTLNVGLVADALVQYSVQQTLSIGIDLPAINVVVAETNDGYLNDIQGRHVGCEHVLSAIQTASCGQVVEGSVGAGAGTSCFGWKGGIGSASRTTPAEAGGYTLGVLVQTNFGIPENLTIAGFPVGRCLQPVGWGRIEAPRDAGSVIVVLATDAPLIERQLRRICIRAAAGLARTGGIFGHGSGEFVVAFSTAGRILQTPPELTESQIQIANEEAVLNPLFLAAAECVEEAVLNSLTTAETTCGRDGHIRYALPANDLKPVISALAAGSRF